MGILEELSDRLKKLEEKSEQQKQELDDLRKLKAEEKRSEWLSKADARKYFINNGKPISHSTMGEWVERWLQEKVLVPNENCRICGTSGKVMISEKFLMDRSKKEKE